MKKEEKILKVYDNSSDVTNIVNIINDINQIAKNLKKDSTYSIINGIAYAYKTSVEDVIHQKLEYSTLSNRNKSKYNDDIPCINGLIDGKELYSFIKDYKKHVVKVIFYEYHFTIETSSSDISYRSISINSKKNLDVDYNKFNKYLERIKIKNSFKTIYKDENFDEKLKEIEIDNVFLPYECKFKISHEFMKEDNEEIIKFRIVKKIFPTLKATSKVSINVFSVNPKDRVYAIEYIIDNKTSKLYNYATIVNY
jgi:hypothetical protein